MGKKRGGVAALGAILLLSVLTSGCKQEGGNALLPQEEYRHLRPSWSPDGFTVAFRIDEGATPGVYLVDSSGQNLRLLKAGEGIGFTWSPDSRWLAFSAIGRLVKILATGDSLTELTIGPGDIRPAWSPDGKRIAFVRTGLWTLDLATGNVAEALTFGNWPSWHPDGRLVYLETSIDIGSVETVYRFNALDLISREIKTFAAIRATSNCSSVAISPAGTEILCSLQPSAFPADLWKCDLSAGRLIRITDSGGDYGSWGPGGVRIVYTRTQKGYGTLWTMMADGSGKRELTTP